MCPVRHQRSTADDLAAGLMSDMGGKPTLAAEGAGGINNELPSAEPQVFLSAVKTSGALGFASLPAADTQLRPSLNSVPFDMLRIRLFGGVAQDVWI